MVSQGVLEHLINPAFYVPQGQVSGALLGWRHVVPRSHFRRLSTQLEAQLSFALGLVFVSLAAFMLMLFLGPIGLAQVEQLWREGMLAVAPAEVQEEQRKVAQVTFSDYVSQDPFDPTQGKPAMAHIEPESREFGLMIPKIGVNSKVMPQVDANKPEVYMQALREGLAQAKGSVGPGELGDNFIFGHSTDFEWNIAAWNALFYNLKDLEVGDKIYLYREGEAYVYWVTGKGIYEPQDVSFFDPNGHVERLVLQTCYPPGTTAQRLVVFAEPVAAQPQQAHGNNRNIAGENWTLSGLIL
ncbi:MAG: sortase [Candidatus Chisholmbacteria bacterium]|nr:sortase [Candidatus Chisholmbacteria bacterium]